MVTLSYAVAPIPVIHTELCLQALMPNAFVLSLENETMNKQRRNALSQIIDQIELLKTTFETLKNETESIRDQIDSERDNEQESFNNLPEGLQQGERGQDMEQAIERLDEASTTITDLFDALDGIDFNDVISNIDEARGE
jgi:seryl-tRNA synthetase